MAKPLQIRVPSPPTSSVVHWRNAARNRLPILNASLILFAMEINTATEITMTKLDAERVAAAIAAHSSGNTSTALLREEIARARIVPQSAIPPDVVTMNSRLRVVDADSGVVSEFTLVYPRDANADLGKVSVLAPIGSALLGLREGQTIEWPLPGGRTKRVTVQKICYQPEASGDFDL